MISREINGLHVVQSELLLAAGVPHGWFDSSLGNTIFRPNNPFNDPEWVDRSEMTERRALACVAIGVDPFRLVETSGLLQTDIVQTLDASHAGSKVGPADGYVTTESGMPVLLSAGDCAQMVLFEPESKVLGVVHAGGLGTSRFIVRKTVQLMQEEYGADPNKMIAAIGPTMSARHFVPTAEADGFTLDDIAASDPVTCELPDGRVGYDVAASNVNQLVAAGLDPARIDVSDIDTYEDTRYFSWERDRQTDVPASMRRHGLFVALPESMQG